MDPEDADLDIDASLPGDPRPGTALARVRAVSLALSDAARRRRISMRRGGRLSSGGFENRQGARIARTLVLASFLLVVALPTFCAILYFGFIAADQYVVESEFTVSAGESPMRDGVDSLSGVPVQLIIQDTQIITNFLHSREIVDELSKRINLKAIYSRDWADALSRLNPKAPIERVVKYWERVSHSTIKLPGGLVKFDVRAFSPEDAKLVADTTLALCEELVNGLNARINRDAVSMAQAEFQHATEELTKTLAAEEVARNQSGILETKMSAEAISGLVRQLKSSLLDLSGAYDAQLRYMGADAAPMRELKSRIDVLKLQIAKVESQLTTSPGAAVDAAAVEGDSTVSAAMMTFGELGARQKAAEQMYENAATALEHARIASEFKLIYLKVYVQPSVPQESEYPSRKLNIFLVALGSLAAWGFLAAIGSLVRNNMA
jgi:capsular polysaccharide transport system permease protein